MNKVFILLIKEPFELNAYGSLKQLFEERKGLIGKSISWFYNGFDFDLEDYEDEKVKILKRSIIRSKQNIL